MCATRGLFVNVALMFGILYPERDLNPQFLFRKLDFKSSVYTIPPPGCVSPNEISLGWMSTVFLFKTHRVLPLKSQPLLGGQDGVLAVFPKTPSVKPFEASATSLFKKRCQIY